MHLGNTSLNFLVRSKPHSKYHLCTSIQLSVGQVKPWTWQNLVYKRILNKCLLAVNTIIWAAMIFLASGLSEHILMQHSFFAPASHVFLSCSCVSVCQFYLLDQPGLVITVYWHPKIYVWLISLGCQGNHSNVYCL